MNNKYLFCVNKHYFKLMDRNDILFTTVRNIIVQRGLFDASIDKKANIPTGSVYTYFRSSLPFPSILIVKTST